MSPSSPHDGSECASAALSKGQKKKLRQKVFRAGKQEVPSVRYSFDDLRRLVGGTRAGASSTGTIALSSSSSSAEQATASSSSSVPAPQPTACFVRSLYGLFPPPEKLLDGDGAEFRLLPCVRWALLQNTPATAAGTEEDEVVGSLKALLSDTATSLIDDDVKFPSLVRKILRKNFAITTAAAALTQRGGPSRHAPGTSRDRFLYRAGGSDYLTSIFLLKVADFRFQTCYLNWKCNGRISELVCEYQADAGDDTTSTTTASVHVGFGHGGCSSTTSDCVSTPAASTGATTNSSFTVRGVAVQMVSNSLATFVLGRDQIWVSCDALPEVVVTAFVETFVGLRSELGRRKAELNQAVTWITGRPEEVLQSQLPRGSEGGTGDLAMEINDVLLVRGCGQEQPELASNSALPDSEERFSAGMVSDSEDRNMEDFSDQEHSPT